MKLKKHVLLSLLTGSLALYSASSGPVIAEAAPQNSVAEVVAQNANSGVFQNSLNQGNIS